MYSPTLLRIRSPFSAGLLALSSLFLGGLPVSTVQAQDAPAAASRMTLEDLYSHYNVIDTDLSPSGKLIAAAIRRENEDAIVCLDLTTGEKKIVTRINKDAFGTQIDVRMGFVVWKSEDRLLFQLRSRKNKGVEDHQLSRGSVLKLGNRLYGVDRDGKNVVPLLGSQYHEALVGAWDTSDIAAMLWKDPKYILVRVGGWDGRSLFRVDVTTGEGKIVEKMNAKVIDWWLDVDGKAVVRVEFSVGELRFYRRLEDGKWKKFYAIRSSELDEQPEYSVIGPSKDPSKFYVLARPPGRDRIGVYLYDLPNEAFGEPLFENPQHDIVTANSMRDGSKVDYYCYDVHVRICEFTDAKANAYMRGLRRFFDETANVFITDASEDENTLLLHVDGPSEPPAYYYYLVAEKKVEFVGLRQGALKDKAVPSATPFAYKARDGLALNGYLTYPPGAKDAKKLPLVLMPHGGPWARDRMEFNPWVQYLAARGYAVFQPNFRGSAGFGQAFENSGDREWGRKMQDDLTDAVKALADAEIVDASRVCIVGGSYGGYAAMAGATLTPDVYRCAVSVAGVSDLVAFIRSDKSRFGEDSDAYRHMVRAVGDPEKDQDAMRAASPVSNVGAVKIPILLIHGEDDERVDYVQSEYMQKALEKSGRKTQLLKLPNEGHSGFEDDTSKVFLSTIGLFLWEHLGKGHGVSDPPKKYVFVD